MVKPTFHRKKRKSAQILIKVTPRFKDKIREYGAPNITAYIEQLVENDIRRKKRRELIAD